MTLKIAQTALDKAKIALMSAPDTIFFTTVLFSLRQVWDDTIPTACTNGLEIRFNPEFFCSLSKDEQLFLLLHEVGHVIFSHMVRRGSRDPGLWNYAGDYVINGMLIGRGFKMPDMGLHADRFANMSTEQVYDLLKQEQPPINPALLDLEEGGGDATGGAGGTDLKDQLDDILVRAALQSRMGGDKPGTIPGTVQIYLDELLNPKLPWTTILRKYFTSLAKNDYSWRKPNRRFFPKYHLPSLYSETLDEITIAVDTSGSVSDEEFRRFVSEVRGILKNLRPKAITLIQFDTRIKAIDTVRDINDLLRLKFTGRGGTNVDDVIEYAETKQPNLLLVFSDGEFNHVASRMKTPVLWVIHGNEQFTAPYGKTIHYTI